MTTHALEDRAKTHPPDRRSEPEPLTRKPAAPPLDAGLLLDGLDARYAAKPDRQHVSASPSTTGSQASATGFKAMIISLKSAQHALDETQPDSNEVTIREQSLIAKRHLEQALRISMYVAHGESTEPLILAAASFATSFHAFVQRTHASLDPAAAKHREVREVDELNEQLRVLLGLDPVAARSAGYKRELASDMTYLRAAVPGAIGTVSTLANSTLRFLESDSLDRKSTIASNTRPLTEAIAYASWLIYQLPEPERAPHNRQVDEAADHILDVLTWIRSRPGGGAQENVFHPVIRHADALLQHLGLPTIESRPPRTLRTEEERHEAKQETDLVASLMTNLKTQLNALESSKNRGIERFAEFAKLEDSKQPSFLLEIASAILVASIGHLGGVIASRIIGAGAGALAKHGAKELGVEGAKEAGKTAAQRVTDSKLGDITTDSIQTLAGNAAQGAANASDKNEQTRARVFFVEGRKQEASAYTKLCEDELAKAIKADAMTVEGLQRDLSRATALNATQVADLYYVESAKAWALYLAQSQLGLDRTRGVDKQGRGVSDVSNYFSPTNNRSNGAGVLDLTFTIRDDPYKIHEPEIQLDDVGINELNGDLRKAIIDDARGVIDRIYLPKEIQFRFVNLGSDRDAPGNAREDTIPAGSHTGFAQLAIDERGSVRDHAGWLHLSPPRGRNKFYRDPQELWERIRRTTLSHHWLVANASRPA